MGYVATARSTTKQAIADHWSPLVSELDMGCDWEDAVTDCWRCGVEPSRGLERCHIVPAQEPFNGPDDPSNYVLLCSRCHREAPNVSDPSVMWQWIKDTHRYYDNGSYSPTWWFETQRDLWDKLSEGCQQAGVTGADEDTLTAIFAQHTGTHAGDSLNTPTLRFGMTKVIEHIAAA